MTEDAKRPQQPFPFLDNLGRRQQQRTVDFHRRREAAKERFAARPQAEQDAIWARVDRLLVVEATWRVARSMPLNPHAYCHRRNFRDDADFRFLIEFLRSGICDREKYEGRWYDVLNRNGRKYWCMNWPLDLGGKWCTIIINKKPVEAGDR